MLRVQLNDQLSVCSMQTIGVLCHALLANTYVLGIIEGTYIWECVNILVLYSYTVLLYL